MDYSLPGSSVHGVLQARILEWVAISFSSIIVLVKEIIYQRKELPSIAGKVLYLHCLQKVIYYGLKF